MTNPNPSEDRTAAWVKAHPRLTTIGLIILTIGIFALIGLREMSKASSTANGTLGFAYFIKSAALVGGALLVVWRANKRMRRH